MSIVPIHPYQSGYGLGGGAVTPGYINSFTGPSQNNWLINVAPTVRQDYGGLNDPDIQIPTNAGYWGSLLLKIFDIVDRHDHSRLRFPEYSVWAKNYNKQVFDADEYSGNGPYYFGKQLSLGGDDTSFYTTGEEWDLLPIVHNKIISSGVSYGIDSYIYQWSGGIEVFTFNPQSNIVDEAKNFSLFPLDDTYGLGENVRDTRRTLYCRMSYQQRQSNNWYNFPNDTWGDVGSWNYPSLDLVWDYGGTNPNTKPVVICSDLRSAFSGIRSGGIGNDEAFYREQWEFSPDVGVFESGQAPFNFVTQNTTTVYPAYLTKPSFISVDTSTGGGGGPAPQDVEFTSTEGMHYADARMQSTGHGEYPFDWETTPFYNLIDEIWMPGDTVWIVDSTNNAAGQPITVKDNSASPYPGIFRYYDSTSTLQSVNTINMNVNGARILLINYRNDYLENWESGGEWFGYRANF